MLQKTQLLCLAKGMPVAGLITTTTLLSKTRPPPLPTGHVVQYAPARLENMALERLTMACRGGRLDGPLDFE